MFVELMAELNQDLSNVAQAFGYTPEELQGIPAESNLGLSCGNPVAVAGIKDVRGLYSCHYMPRQIESYRTSSSGGASS